MNYNPAIPSSEVACISDYPKFGLQHVLHNDYVFLETLLGSYVAELSKALMFTSRLLVSHR